MNETLQIADTVSSYPRSTPIPQLIYIWKHGGVCFSTPSNSTNPNQTEDCLFLDVYAPTYFQVPQPVFVWFQGGGFNSLANPNQNGSNLIQTGDFGIVFVTLNYRVGPYGFLASREVQVR
jgi:carboxylesterase type B